jgi:hypothetical protein
MYIAREKSLVIEKYLLKKSQVSAWDFLVYLCFAKA